MGKDTTVYAPDLFLGRTIVSMDWQQVPHSIIWAALDDGSLLGLTYVRDHDIWAWHEHTFRNGNVEQVCVVPEGTEDVVYMVIKRTIGGSTKRYIERFENRDFDTVDESFFVDCGLQYDGRNTTNHTMTATSVSGGWTPNDVILLTASAASFTNPTDVGNAIVLQNLADGTTYDSTGRLIPSGTILAEITLTIITYLSTTTVNAVPQGTLPAWAQVALTTWGKAVRAFSGISHLNGQSISVLADGNVVASPLALNDPDGRPDHAGRERARRDDLQQAGHGQGMLPGVLQEPRRPLRSGSLPPDRVEAAAHTTAGSAHCRRSASALDRSRYHSYPGITAADRAAMDQERRPAPMGHVRNHRHCRSREIAWAIAARLQRTPTPSLAPM